MAQEDRENTILSEVSEMLFLILLTAVVTNKQQSESKKVGPQQVNEAVKEIGRQL